ncbi:MAG: ABC transporter substrate-binding protein [Bradymonadia bacterium]
MHAFKKITAVSLALSIAGVTGCGGDEEQASAGTSFKYQSVTGKCQVLAEGDVYMGIAVSVGGDVWPVAEFIDIANLAVTEINNQGGLGDKGQLGAILCDTECLPETGTAVFDELLDAKNSNGIDVPLIVGPSCSYVAVEVIDKAKAANVAVIGSSTESTELTSFDDGDYYFRSIASSAQLGTAQGAYLASEQQLDKLAVLYPVDAWGPGMAFETSNKFAEVTVAQGCEAGTSDVTGDGEDDVLSMNCPTEIQLLPYRYLDEDNTTPEFDGAAIAAALDNFTTEGQNVGVFLIGYEADTFIASLLSEINRQEWSNGAPYVELTNTMTTEFWNIVGDSDLLEGIGGITAKAPDSAAAQHFAEAILAATGSEVQNYWGNLYDAIYLGAAAMAIAPDATNGPGVRDSLRKTGTGTKVSVGDWAGILAAAQADGQVDIDGATGPQDFDANGDVSSLFTHQRFNSSGQYETSGCWLGDGTPCE